jgi:hypothetical protein
LVRINCFLASLGGSPSLCAHVPIHTYKPNPPYHLTVNMPTSKSKTEKIEGVKKHNELVRAKKKATKERKSVALPAGYKKKK